MLYFKYYYNLNDRGLKMKLYEIHNESAIDINSMKPPKLKNNVKKFENIILPSKKNKSISLKIEFTIKHIIDFFAGIIGIIILIPLTIMVYILNKIYKEDGPIFYKQERIGKDGKIFQMIKYRTMVVGADEKLQEYLENNEEARKEYKKYKKLKNDPRITKVGKILRKTSLDEFPQVVHLLSGKMSLVGPRPYLVREREDMGNYYYTIIKCIPGLGGLWQIEGRSNLTFQDRLDLDIKYYETWSLKNDIKILLKTLIKVFGKDAAI